jgi:hypothetical protein
MHRVLTAARLHLIHPLAILGIPWLIVAISFAINVAIWRFTAAGAQDGGFTGGVLALYITVLVVYAQSVTQLLPFAMGISLSRRTFFLGTALMALVQSIGYGIALTALVALENSTDGWGSGLAYWAPGPFEVDNPAFQVLVSGAPMLAFAFVGLGIGIVHQRWGQAGTWGLIIGSMVVVGGLVFLVSWLDAWSDVFGWFADQSQFTVLVGLPAALAVAVALVSFPGIRRVVP